MKRSIILLGLLALLAGVNCLAAVTNGICLIPQPQKMTVGTGAFTLNADTIIYTDHASIETGNQLAAQLCRSTGFLLRVVPRSSAAKAIKNAIWLTTESPNPSLGQEGYELTVAPDFVVVHAPAQAGLFYGAQSLMQLLPSEIFSPGVVSSRNWTIPSVQIEDQPRFVWRGMMLDVSRDFFTKQEVERLLDLLALHKINTFHWHLVDNNGWRIEIKKYPNLTEAGAWREHPRVTPARQNAANLESATAHPAWAGASPANFRADGRYGGFYTQDDIREVVAYAAALHITIVPEIEMPGHSAAALLAYPKLNCTGVTNGQVYCAGNEASFEFLENVLTEVFQLFPGKYIHIGGDEVNTANWKKCDLCQTRMKTEGLTNVDQLQSYFIKRMEKSVNAHGRSLIGWSEIQKGGLAPSATVMDWIGGAVESASTGHDVVMSPETYAYLDHYQSRDHSTEPWAIGGFLPLSQVYGFEPVPASLPAQYQSHILGAQGNLWTEYVASFKHVEYMAFPRICAMAEVGWSPKSARNWDDFSKRLTTHLRRLDELGVNYRPLTVPPAKPEPAR
jgi:hexosaminidase